jgi:hypothetical protein
MMAEDRGPQVAAVAILFLALSWVAVSLRCYVRTVMMKSFGADDWLAVVSLVSKILDLVRKFEKCALAAAYISRGPALHDGKGI